MKENIHNYKFYTLNNSNNTSTIAKANKSFFPSLTHKELMSLHELKLKTNYEIRNKRNNNYHRNFHSEVMKTNLKENSKFSTLYKDTSTSTKTETSEK